MGSHVPHLTPLPTTHFHSSLYSFGWLTYFTSFLFFIFSQHNTNISLILPHPLPHYPLQINISTIIFPARSPENCCEPISNFTSFFEVKVSNLFGGFHTFAWGYFYLSFNIDTHVIYEHWKWYLCIFMYGFCIGGVIWWVGIWFVLIMTT